MKDGLTRALRFCLGVAMVVAGWIVLVGLLQVGWSSHLLGGRLGYGTRSPGPGAWSRRARPARERDRRQMSTPH